MPPGGDVQIISRGLLPVLYDFSLSSLESFLSFLNHNVKRKYLGCRFLPRQFQCGSFPGWTWCLVGFSGIVSFSPPSSGNGLKYRAAKLFTAYIRSTLLFLFSPGYIAKGKYSFFHLVLWGSFIFTSSPSAPCISCGEIDPQ